MHQLSDVRYALCAFNAGLSPLVAAVIICTAPGYRPYCCFKPRACPMAAKRQEERTLHC